VIVLNRIGALVRKEFAQIRRDRRLVIALIVPPVLQLTLFGFALSASVSDLRVGIVDESRSPESRELVATLTESRSFHLGGYFTSGERLDAAISQGKVDVGVVIPYQYARDLHRGGSPTVQVLLNAMNANTATIGHGYVQGVIESYNRSLSRAPAPATGDAAPAPHRAAQVHLMPAFLYNPGLVDAWFIATGVFGLLLILNSSLIASAAMVKEREAGTIEQLLMSPASTAEIIVAKIVRLVFRVPFNGSLLLVSFGGVLCILSGISLGMVIATFSRSAQQAQLTAFFVNPPMSSLSGALSPVEAMPDWLQPLTVLNPIHHFATIVRGSMLKGAGLATLWPNMLVLIAFTLVLVSLSVWWFRKQLA
jgi:ABC-2 type transport system permease protein